MKYYNKIAEIRQQRGYSQRKIAEVLNTTQQQIYKYEKGMQEMTVSRFIELADFYELSLDDLAGRTQSQTQTQKS